ncbi:TIGR04190 family B12-binding domain/radical SAM domain protein [Chloroflexota bacterium]
MSVDLILLHAPSVYDFRKKTILYGPVSEQIPSSYVFEMFPIGLTSIAEYLERAGYRVRIINLAVRMMRDSRFDVEAEIRRLQAPVFGIDLHWLVHSHGSIEVARIVKKYHPEAKVIFGGFSSSYFYRKLIRYPEIDYVLRGDSTEEPFRKLMECVKQKTEPEAVPNLVWKDKRGGVRENKFTHIPADLSDVMAGHYGNVIGSVLRHRDLTSYLPFKDWLRYPITAVFTCRGCNENCVVCGGSSAAFRCYLNRQEAVFRPLQAVFRDIKQIERFSNGPIFILGDLRQPGEDYADELLRLLEKDKAKNRFILELFRPASRELLEQMSRSCPDFCLEISPESHDPEIRKASGKHYSNEDLEQTLGDALATGCGRLDVFFMIGLPNQTRQSVMETVDYCGHLLDKFHGDKRLSLFISPLAPFLDPGSLGYEKAERYGYHVLFRTLEEYRQALVSPSWKYSLNYETNWLSRQQITEVAYEAMLRLTRLKAKYGLISTQMAEAGEQRVKASIELMRRIDDIIAGGNLEELDGLREEINRVNMFPVSDRKELELPTGMIKLKLWRPLWTWLTRRQ